MTSSIMEENIHKDGLKIKNGLTSQVKYGEEPFLRNQNIYSLIGKKINMLTVINEVKKPEYPKATFCICRCDCGNTVTVKRVDIKRGNTKSCGCLRSAKFKERVTKHGLFNDNKSEYKTWSVMKSRCFNSNDKNYDRYGGRGISVCDRWANSFENFFEDMGKRPSNYELDRIDNNKNYDPSNCRWTTRQQQVINRGVTVFFEYGGIRKHLAAWARHFNVPPSTLRNRIKICGGDLEYAIKKYNLCSPQS